MLTPHDPAWTHQYESAAAELRRVGNRTWLIEHIGSTAVPGLSAKPIIDLAVRVDDEQDYQEHRPQLEQAGWCEGSSVRSHHVLLRVDGGKRTHIAHFFERGVWDAVNQRLFRDWLLAHPDHVRQYEQVKHQAARDAAAGRISYNAGKTAFVQKIVDHARAARGLLPVPVTDK